MSSEKFIALVQRQGAVPSGVRLHSAEGYVSRTEGLHLRVPDLDISEIDLLVEDVSEFGPADVVVEDVSGDN